VTRTPGILCKKLGLEFIKPQLFKMALTHRSVGANNNERLEFLGDSILGFVIAQRLYEKFPEASEGVLSRLRAGLVNQASLADLAREIEIGHHLLLGSGELKSGGFRRDSILSDALEAIMGAIILDQGVEACRRWILRIFEEKISRLSLQNWQKDPKTMLQETMQSRKLDLPEYSLVNMNGLPHEQMFQVACCISLLPEACIGMGLSRKKAEQAAAEKVLAMLVEISGK
jgi:ribonuclease-3